MMRHRNKFFLLLILGVVLVPASLFAYSQAENFRYPLNGSWTVTRDFWEYITGRGWHLGEDGDGSATTPVYAPSNGIIKHIMNRTGYGNVVIIEHYLSTGEYVTTIMGHMRSDIQVAVGQEVSKGQLLGYLGDSSQNGGYVPHSHFGTNKGTYAGDNATTCGGEWVYAGYTDCSYVNSDW